MEGKSTHLPPGDPQLITNIVNHLKSQGIFDQFRRDLLADADTKPSYQNLRQRVEGYASKFLAQQTWQPDLNKNQLRDTLRRQINESGMLASGVDHVLEQLLSPKIFHVFLPQVENLVKEYLGLKKPPPPDPFHNSDKVVSDSKTDTILPKTEEVAAVQNNSSATMKRPLERSTSEPTDLKPPKQDAKVTAQDAKVTAIPDQEKTDDEMADDSVLISESGAEQSDSSIFDYTGPLGKTPPPPGVSEDEIESLKKVADLETTEKEKIQSASPEREKIKTELMEQEINPTEATEMEQSADEAMEHENSGPEISILEAENVSQNSDSKDAPMKHVLEEEKSQQKQEVRPPEKKPESTKVISEKEKKSEKSKILQVHEKARSVERDRRSKSVDSSRSKSSESKISSKLDMKQKSENSQQKMQESKLKKADGLSSKSKPSSFGGIKKQESGHLKTPRDPTRSSEQKNVKLSSESPVKIDKQRSYSAHSTKSASSSSSKSPKLKTSSYYKSGKPEGKTTSSKSDSSKTSKHTSFGSKTKHSTKPALKHRHSEDSKEEKAKVSTLSQSKSQPSEEKHEKSKLHTSKSQGPSKSSSMQKTKIVEEKKSDQKRLPKEGKHSRLSEKVELKDSELKICKDGHGCVEKSPEKQLHGTTDCSSNEESISSPQTCGTNTGCDSEPNTCSIPSEKCKPVGSDIEKNADDSISDPVEAEPVEAVLEENSTSCEDRPDDFLRELLMEKKVEANLDETKSDITVSSVHTSDLSSFDDRISLSSADEIPEVEQKKKIPLKEVKVIAAVLKEKSNSSGRSTPVMSTVEPEANQQEISFQQEEIQQDDVKSDEFHTEEDKDGSKMWLRRQRKVNPKYTSEEYSSIFNEGASICDSESIEDVPPRRITRSSQDAKLGVATCTSQDVISGEKQDPQKRKLSKNDEPETKSKAAKIAKRNQPVENTEVSSKKEIQLKQSKDRRRNTRSDSESQEVPEQTPVETSRRKRRSTSSSTISPDTPKHEPQTRALTSSQRYDSSDLYKPRPIITSRRTRSTQDTPNTQDSSVKGRTTRQSSPAPKRR